MAGKKKTNYVSYELKKLENYVSQLQKTLDKNPPHKAEDRIELIDGPRGGTIIKVIATKEQQLKAFMDILKEMPKLLEDINKLRKAVDGVDEKEARGGSNIPGFMDADDDDDEPEVVSSTYHTEVKNEEKFDEEEEETEEENPDQKELPPAGDDEEDDVDPEWPDED